VFTGSSNLAEGGETQNGDNLLAIYDPGVARLFATEAVRLVDHYYFRAAVSQATSVSPLVLSACGTGAQSWWQRDYDPQNMRNVQRLLFADGPSAVTTIPAGISDPGPAAKPAKATGKKKAPAKGAKTAPAAATPAPAKTKAKATTPAKAKPAKAAKKAAPKKKTAAKKSATKKKAAPRQAAARKTKPRTAAKTKRPAKKTARKTRR